MASKTKSKITPKGITCLLICLFGAFGIMGILLIFVFFILPVRNIIQAKSWVEAPCTITKSEIESHSSKGRKKRNSSTYKVIINFKYIYKDKEYEGGQYNFDDSSSSGYAGKEEIISNFPVGFSTKCYLNPQKPSSAVLNKDFYASLWFAILPLIFICIGFGGIYFTFKSKKKPGLTEPSGYNKNLNSRIGSADPFFVNNKILSSTSPWVTFLFALFGTTFWNVIVIYAIYQDCQFEINNLSGFLWIFVIIGLLLILLCFYNFLLIFNPTINLELINQNIKLGDNFLFKLNCKGNFRKIKKLKITLIAFESASYQNGKHKKTKTNKFLEEILLITEVSDLMFGKTITFKIPENTMCSFQSNNNAITWKICVEGEIKLYPDIDSEFIIKVAPV